MFLDKFRNRYSFNFLSACGLIIFLLLCIIISPYTLLTKDGLSFIPLFLFCQCLFVLDILFYIITFFIYVFEIISWKRITSEKFLNNKHVKIFQTLGIAFSFLPIMIIAIFYII